MKPTIQTITPKKFIGKRQTLSLVQNTIGQLWASFMPHKKDIKAVIGSNLYSIATYDPNYFTQFNPNNLFERWAAVEVTDFLEVPKDMEILEILGGLYAVFEYKGLSSDTSIFQYIYGTWLPASEYELDQRPHFEVLGDKYKNNHPDSEEEIWIPIKLKKAETS